MKITRKSPISGNTNTMDLDVTPEQMAAWENGELSQYAFPNLKAGEREFIISGVTPEEWNKTFGEEGVDTERESV